MRLFSYVVARDYGFAPNPFGGYCTLATCKPEVRESASVGDWVVGTGSVALGNQGRLIYAMRVTEKLTFSEYWNDPRYFCKRPVMNGSLKQMYGDNIYSYHQQTGEWIQADSHHSLPDGQPNPANIKRDLKSKHVLISEEFYYFGKDAVALPAFFRGKNDSQTDLCISGRGRKCYFPPEFVALFVKWLRTEFTPGYYCDPKQFTDFERYDGTS